MYARPKRLEKPCPQNTPQKKRKAGFCLPLLILKILFANKFLAGGEFHTLVCTIVDANALVFDNLVAEHSKQVVVVGQHVDGLQGLWNGAGFDGAVADLCAADGAPHFMSTDAGVENFGNGVEGKFAGFGDHHIHHTHEVIGSIHSVEGVIVKTKQGEIIHKSLEQYLIKKAPGYNMIKQVLDQFLGRDKTPFTSVALVRPFANDTYVTAFVTTEHPNGMYTVFVPTGPNPTTGFIFHLEAKYVQKVNVSIEKTMQTIISCGAGSTPIIDAGIQSKPIRPRRPSRKRQ